MQKRNKQNDAIQGLTALYSGVLQNLSMAQSADNAIEAKAVGVTALSLASIALVAQLSERWNFLTILAVVLLIGSLISAFLSLKINDYKSAAVRVRDHPQYLDKDDKDLLLQLIADAEASYDNVDTIVLRKAKFFTCSYTLLLLGALVGLASLRYVVAQI